MTTRTTMTMSNFGEDEEYFEMYFQDMLDSGSLEVIENLGKEEPFYRVTEKCKELFPKIYEAHRSTVSNTAFSLWQKGLIEIDIDQNQECINFTNANYRNFIEFDDYLSDDEFTFMNVLMAKVVNHFESLGDVFKPFTL